MRGLFRFVPYVLRLWRVTGQVDIVHVMANSGWSWHLCAAPAIWIAHWRRVPAVVNYRGGEAGTFLARSSAAVRRTLRRSAALIVPSGFLQGGVRTPWNAGRDRSQHHRSRALSCRHTTATARDAPHLVVARNLEPIYDIPTALRAFALVRNALPDVRMTVAGSGPERAALELLSRELGIEKDVMFCGTRDRDEMAALYRSATVVLNPSRVDNMPNSVLEAMASGVPVVSTNVGGVPFILRDDVTGLMVPAGDPQAMADAVLRLLGNPEIASRIAAAATRDVQQYAWAHVRQRWADVYRDATAGGRRALAGSDPPITHAGFYTRVVSRTIFPLHERLKGHSTVAVRNALEVSQWWPPERLAAAQFARLEALLRNANDSVPYYRDLFRRIGFDPRVMTALADLERLPFLTKADIRANTEALKATSSTGLARSNTGGSSGEPLVFFLGKERVSHDVAAKWRATRWWGVDIGDREIVVWGSPIELHAQDLVRKLRDSVLRTRLLPAFEMSDAKLDDFVAAIRDVRPSMLFGYPSALARIARHAAARAIPLNALGIKVAFVTSERLYDDQRAAIESGFGCPVANGYGGRDAGFIAHACPQGGMHITTEDIIVETIGADGRPVRAGESGEIVVTHLAIPRLSVHPVPHRRLRRPRYAAVRLRPRVAAAAGNPGPQHRFRGRGRRHAHARTRAYLRHSRPPGHRGVQDHPGNRNADAGPDRPRRELRPGDNANHRAGSARPPGRKGRSRRRRSRGHCAGSVGKVSLRREQGCHLNRPPWRLQARLAFNWAARHAPAFVVHCLVAAGVGYLYRCCMVLGVIDTNAS